jgi:hypothetical protein
MQQSSVSIPMIRRSFLLLALVAATLLPTWAQGKLAIVNVTIIDGTDRPHPGQNLSLGQIEMEKDRMTADHALNGQGLLGRRSVAQNLCSEGSSCHIPPRNRRTRCSVDSFWML